MLKLVLKRYLLSKALTSGDHFKSKSAHEDVETTTPNTDKQTKMLRCHRDVSFQSAGYFWRGSEVLAVKRHSHKLASMHLGQPACWIKKTR